MLFAAVRQSLMAQRCVRRDAPFRTRLDNNGQKWILVRDGSAVFDPTATLGLFGFS
jgi:hypothetical protein